MQSLNFLAHGGMNHPKKKNGRFFFIGIVGVVACIGFFLAIVFVATRFHLTDLPGSVDPHAERFAEIEEESQRADTPSFDTASEKSFSVAVDMGKLTQLIATQVQASKNDCLINTIKKFAGHNAQVIERQRSLGASEGVITKMFGAVDFLLQGNHDYEKQKASCRTLDGTPINRSTSESPNDTSVFPWEHDNALAPLQKAILKDVEDITKAGQNADVDPRMIASVLFVEQTRVYTTEREFVKKVLEPFGLLSTGNNLSLGTMNIKPNTALQIEHNLQDKNSPYYPGDAYAHLLDFQTNDPAKERIKRLTSYTDRYYSYLYCALYLKEYEAQWARAHVPIDDRPEILATLFNIGFAHSQPNPTPKPGGSTLVIDGVKYTFGGLAYEFYYSGVMDREFPMH